MSNELWSFETARFKVLCTAEPEHHEDLSWDHDGSVRAGIDSGDYDLFCAKVTVFLDGREIASDYLGGCVYAPGEFVESHRDPDPMNRNCSIMRDARGARMCIGHYFPDMVSIAIAEARQVLRDAPYIRQTVT